MTDQIHNDEFLEHSDPCRDYPESRRILSVFKHKYWHVDKSAGVFLSNLEQFKHKYGHVDKSAGVFLSSLEQFKLKYGHMLINQLECFYPV